MSTLQWYPGHMTKAKRQMSEDLKLIDLIIELLDARAPKSSQNPDIDKMVANKSRIVLLTKSDLADKSINEKWVEYFTANSTGCVCLDLRNNHGMKPVREIILKACSEKIERNKKKGIKNRPIRAMIVGIPNVGKSTFINSYAKKSVAKTGNKPGVTKGRQWIRLDKNVELLDTPGILWPKFDDTTVGEHLGMIGSIKDEVMDLGELAVNLIKYLQSNYPGSISNRYEIDENNEPFEVLMMLSKKRGCIKKGNEVDYDKGSRLFLNDFRSGQLGKISLESPSQLF